MNGAEWVGKEEEGPPASLWLIVNSKWQHACVCIAFALGRGLSLLLRLLTFDEVISYVSVVHSNSSLYFYPRLFFICQEKSERRGQ
jgi:hypothetical protein